MTHFKLSASDPLPVPVDVIRELLAVAEAHSVPVVLIGAAARDLVVTRATGRTPARATSDLDVAVAVPDWDRFTAFRSGLDAAGHRIRGEHKAQVRDVDVDIVPFGGLAEDLIVEFRDSRLDVAGLEEAAQAADTVELPDGTIVRVASLVAQSVLKLLAWRDRRDRTSKDAVDWYSIVGAASDGPYGAALREGAGWEAMEVEEFVPDVAGAHHLGHQAAGLCHPRTRESVTALLADDRLMASFRRQRPSSLSDDHLDAYRRGWQKYLDLHDQD